LVSTGTRAHQRGIENEGRGSPPRGAGWTVRLHEKGRKEHAMPCHHALAEALRTYIDTAGIAEDRKGWLFRTCRGHNAAVLSEQPMNQSDAWRMIRQRAVAASIHAPIGNHTFRAKITSRHGAFRSTAGLPARPGCGVHSPTH
jgi:integrase